MSLYMSTPLFISLTFFTLVSATIHLHPLDPLNAMELTQVQTIVERSHPGLAFHYIGLAEPDKSSILSWLATSLNQSSTTPSPRQAMTIIRHHNQTHEIIVDLLTTTIIYNRVYTGFGYPSLSGEEVTMAMKLPLTYPPFVISVRKRGLKLDQVVCQPYPIGWFGVQGKREVKLACYYLEGTVNMHARPLEGISVVVDLEEMKISKYFDRVRVAVPKAEGTEYRLSQMRPSPISATMVNRITVVQPDGPGFKIDGHIIRNLDVSKRSLETV
ncbi:hypothetical protein Syun_007444 [Stephania yunnanensis]|uniref:Amine oxidase n=1 Tax=Stephania yunnanensis TaxID=152371 RepID=A0AAP0L001_9MAGN